MAEIRPMPVAEIRRLMRRPTVEPVEDIATRCRRAYLRGYLWMGAKVLTADELEAKLRQKAAAA